MFLGLCWVSEETARDSGRSIRSSTFDMVCLFCFANETT